MKQRKTDPATLIQKSGSFIYLGNIRDFPFWPRESIRGQIYFLLETTENGQIMGNNGFQDTGVREILQGPLKGKTDKAPIPALHHTLILPMSLVLAPGDTSLKF